MFRWLPEAQLYHYKARAYLPALGRFLQTDPIGFAGGMSLYAYVGNDPVNARDPWGLDKAIVRLRDDPITSPPGTIPDHTLPGVFVNGTRPCRGCTTYWGQMTTFGQGTVPIAGTNERGGGGDDCHGEGCDEEIVVTALRRNRDQCLASLDQAARQAWEGQQSVVNGVTIIVAGGVVLTGSTLTANPLTTLFGGGLIVSGTAFTAAALAQRAGGLDTLNSYGLGAYGRDLSNRATAATFFLGPNTYALPSQLGVPGLCEPLVG